MELSGIFPAITTPFNTDESVSLSQLRHNIEHYNATRLAGYVVLGSTGESVLLSPAERQGILEAARTSAGANKILVAGTGAESTFQTIEWTKRAAALGYDMVLVKTPYYYKPSYTPEILIEHFRRVADASPIPVLLYSVPVFTGVTLEAGEVGVLAEHPNIVGIKESSGNVQRCQEIISSSGRPFQVLVGSAATLLASLVMGASGAILALACPYPSECVTLFELFKSGSWDEARRLQSNLLMASNLIVSQAGIAGVKYAMDTTGYCGGLPRPPLIPLAAPIKQRIQEATAALRNYWT